MSIEGTWGQMRNFTFWKKSWRKRKEIKGKLPSTYICLQPTNSFFWAGGLGLPKFHVLSFWNWLGIRNQLGSWVLKQQQQGRHTQSS
jgi:hypothetical protein